MRIINTLDELNDIFDFCISVQYHDCNSCRKKIDAYGNEICRSQPYPLSEQFWLTENPQQCSREAAAILRRLNLIYYTDDFNYSPQNDLRCPKYQYPSSAGEHIIPYSPELFALTLTSGNVQLTTENFCSKYLNKVAAGKEEHATVEIKPGSADGSFTVSTPELHSTKTTGSEIRKEKKDYESRPVAPVAALQVSQTEYLWWLQKLPVVITNIKFVHVPSLALEYRGGKYFNQPRRYIQTSGSSNDVLNLREQLNFPQHNCFSARQKVHIEDASNSHFSIDKLTLFSIKPPELFFVRQLELYFKFFIRQAPKKQVNNQQF